MPNELLESLLNKQASALPDRTPPHDLEAEQSLLGCVLLSNGIMEEIVDFGLKTMDFYRPAHRKIFQSMMELFSSGIEIDTVTLKAKLSAKNKLDDIGGVGYLLDLSSSAVLSNHWRNYAHIIVEKSKFRRLAIAGTQIAAMAFDQPENGSETIVASSLELLNSIALDGNTDIRASHDILDEFISDLYTGKQDFITPRGVPEVRVTNGDFLVIAAGTSVGKTAITLDWANDWSKTKKVAYFEYEMAEKELISRLICRDANVSLKQLQDRDLTPDDIMRIEDASDNLKKNQLYIEEVWCDINILTAKIRKAVTQLGVEIIMLDHIGLIPYERPRNMSEAKAIGVYITNPLKRLAAELGVIIVGLVQINRESQKDGSFPRLHHLRDSGEIEQDASIVLTLWSERLIRDNWQKRLSIREHSGLLTDYDIQDDSFYLFRIGYEKNRNGPTGEVFAKYRGEHFKFEFAPEEVREVKQGSLM